jgi:hypothetical protein
MTIRSEVFIQPYSALILAGTSQDLFAITVPAKAVLKVLSFGNYTDTVLAWTVINWVFYLDNLLLYPFNAIFDQWAFGTERQRIQGIEITGGHTLRIQANNPTAGNVRMGISLEYELSYPEQ